MNFSVISKNNKGYKTSKKSYDEYKDSILNEERLKIREEIFFKHTAPLVIKNNKKMREIGIAVKLCIAISDLLPEKIVNRFKTLIKNNPNAFGLIIVNEESNHNWEDILKNEVYRECCLEQEKSDEAIVANFRLDDDDILSKNYFMKVRKYLKNAFSDMFLTFPKGYIGVYNNGYNKFYEVNKPFLAIGLAKISRYDSNLKQFQSKDPCIFGRLSHAKILNNSASILDSNSPSYIWTMHKHSDTRSVDSNEKQTWKKIEDFISENNLKEADKNIITQDFITLKNK